MFLKSVILTLLLVGGLTLVIFSSIHMTQTKYTYRVTNLYYDEVNNLVLEDAQNALRILYTDDETQTYCLLENSSIRNQSVDVTHYGVLFSFNNHPVFYCVLITNVANYIMLCVGVGMLLLSFILIWTLRSSLHM